jgi:hypothetical protein
MDELPNWVQALLAVYLLGGGFIVAIVQTITMVYEKPKIWMLGIVLEAYDNLKEKLNTCGLIIAIVFTTIATLPGIILCATTQVIIWTVQGFWNLFTKIFRKRTENG